MKLHIKQDCPTGMAIISFCYMFYTLFLPIEDAQI